MFYIPNYQTLYGTGGWVLNTTCW